MKTTKAIENTAKSIIGSDPISNKLLKTLVFYGNAKVFGSNFAIKGHARVSHSKLQAALERFADVIYVDEFRTSKLCSKCYNPLILNER